MDSQFHPSPSKDFNMAVCPLRSDGRGLQSLSAACFQERLSLCTEPILCRFAQNPSTIEMLLKAQNAVGELYLEIGMTQKGLSYFLKAWSNLLRFTLSDLKSSQELMKQKGRRHLQRPLHS